MLETLLVNLGGTKLTRLETLEGREYIVTPMVMITEGVFEGNNGPLYYPEEELAKTPGAWDHKPIVNYHPERNGMSISACDPIVLETRKVGIILNTKWGQDKKLRAEAWLDKVKLAKVDPRVLQAIEAGNVIEVSTGLFTDNQKTEGEFKGRKYTAIARNYRPDHLAILYDKRGACSVADGAGLNTNQTTNREFTARERKRLAKTGAAMKDGSFPIVTEQDLQSAVRAIGRATNPAAAKRHITKRAAALGKTDLLPDDWKLTKNEAEPSFEQIVVSLRNLLATKHGVPGRSWDGFLEDVYPSEVIFYNAGELYSQTYTLEGNSVSLSGEAVQVRRVVSYQPTKPVENQAEPTNNSVTTNEDSMKTRQDRVTALIANGVYKEEHRKMLEEAPDALFDVIEAGVQKKPEEKKDQQQNNQQSVVVPTPAPVPQPMTTEQYIASAPDGIRDLLVNALAAHNAQKAQLIATITANKANQFTKEYLETQSIQVLIGLAALAAPATQTNNQQPPVLSPNYLGAAAPAPTANQAPVEGLKLPAIDWTK